MILCCGEALIDMIPVTGSNGAAAFAPLSGGAIFNTSISLGRLGVPVGLLSGVSNDLLGEQLVDELRASNVSPDLLIRSDRPTTLAFVKLTDGHAEYTFYDENSAGRLIERTDLPDFPASLSTVYFGGISLCAEPAASTYEALFHREARTRVAMIDPNIRPSFITDEPAYRARLDRMIAAADIVKVSDEDLDWIVASEASVDNKIEVLHQMGATLVVVTKGGGGASACLTGQQVINISAPNVTVVDTVGAGDTFNAGFLAKLYKLDLLSKKGIKSLTTDQISEALEFASQVAAVTISRAGANPPFLSEMTD